jgi:hypothetical protein
MFTALLTDENIPWFIKDRGTGGYMKIYMGYSIYGQDIYVGSEDYDKAKELLDYYLNTAVYEETDQSEAPEHDIADLPADESQRAPFKKSTIARLIISYSLLTLFIIWLLSRYL